MSIIKYVKVYSVSLASFSSSLYSGFINVTLAVSSDCFHSTLLF